LGKYIIQQADSIVYIDSTLFIGDGMRLNTLQNIAMAKETFESPDTFRNALSTISLLALG